MTVKYVCPKCQSERLYVLGDVMWNVLKQEWEATQTIRAELPKEAPLMDCTHCDHTPTVDQAKVVTVPLMKFTCFVEDPHTQDIGSMWCGVVMASDVEDAQSKAEDEARQDHNGHPDESYKCQVVLRGTVDVAYWADSSR